MATKKKSKPTPKKKASHKAPSKQSTKAKKPPQKKINKRKAPMSKAQSLTRAEVSIMARMATLEPDTPRYRVLDAALSFKASWVILGEHLADVLKGKLWRQWGFPSFERYCAEEVQITSSTAKKLVRSFTWLGEEAPEYLPSHDDGKLTPKKDALPLPDFAAVQVLADAHRHLQQSRVPEDAYLSLKQAAFDGESASVLKRTLKEAIPVPKKADDRVRHLRRALSASVKVIDALREWDVDGGAGGEDVLVQAESLRDAIALRLPREPEAKDEAA